MQEYNCTNSSDSSYGASAYGTCASEVGAPNTGVFQQILSGGSFEIIAPIVVALALTLAAVVVSRRRKKASQ